MTTPTTTDWRSDVIAHGHGDHDGLPHGVERDAIDVVRFLAADAVERAGLGHPDTPMALAPLATRLYTTPDAVAGAPDRGLRQPGPWPGLRTAGTNLRGMVRLRPHRSR